MEPTILESVTTPRRLEYIISILVSIAEHGVVGKRSFVIHLDNGNSFEGTHLEEDDLGGWTLYNEDQDIRAYFYADDVQAVATAPRPGFENSEIPMVNAARDLAMAFDDLAKKMEK
jgi:hypothetical protein